MVLDAENGRRRERARRYVALAAEAGLPPAPLAIAWCLRNPHVSTVILGASRVEQLLQNLDALDLAERVDDALWRRIEAVDGGVSAQACGSAADLSASPTG